MQTLLTSRIRSTKNNLTDAVMANGKPSWALNIGFHLLKVLYPRLSPALQITCSPKLQEFLVTPLRDLRTKADLPEGLMRTLHSIKATADEAGPDDEDELGAFPIHEEPSKEEEEQTQVCYHYNRCCRGGCHADVVNDQHLVTCAWNTRFQNRRQ